MLKRAIDVIVAAALLVLAAPALGVAAALVRMAMGPPVLFRQARAGYRGRPFTLYKFRTMRELVDAEGRPLPDSVRLTRLGRLLRCTSIDELPQLVNVLRGDMSLVGPRPLLVQYLDRYTPEQARRHEVRPGMTGWAQVNGRNAIGWEERFALDVWYVDHWSLRLDAWIVCLTVWGLLRRTGINHAADAPMPEFTGSPARTGIAMECQVERSAALRSNFTTGEPGRSGFTTGEPGRSGFTTGEPGASAPGFRHPRADARGSPSALKEILAPGAATPGRGGTLRDGG